MILIGLEVSHFGQLFTHDDVEGISDIFRGTKPQDDRQIGKFGIGFKSVYAFTESPEIHSGDEHFVIERYIRPRGIDVRPLEKGETLFILPFNHSSLDVEEAYSRIYKRLTDLDLHTLLFLNYIDEIAWEVNGRHSGIYLRETHRESDEFYRWVTLIGERGDGTQENEWLIFSQVIDIEGATVPSRVEVAYKLETDQKN